MAIKLDVKDYCSGCCDFEADVTKPEKVTLYSGAEAIVTQTDTMVRCKYAARCANLVRYLKRQVKENAESGGAENHG